MSDRLEDFVKGNREQFDLREPDPSVWLKINPATVPLEGVQDAPALKERRSVRWLRIAAAVAVIFAATSAGIWFLSGDRSGTELYSEMYLEMQETEQYYNQMVAQRFEELQPYLASDPAADEMLQMDFQELDEVYEDLKEDLNDNVSNPQVIEAMILNYKVKLEILEDLLYQLKEKENQDYESNGSYSL